MVSIPFSKNKHHLTGIDWIVHAFDYMNKRATGAGNAFQIVMEFDDVVPEDELRSCLDCFVSKFPVLGGRTKRDYNLAPYWKMPSAAGRTPVALDVHHVGNDRDVPPLLEMEVNRPFGSEREHLAFHLICTEQKSYVAATFDHRLFDAHGAEAFLGMFQRDCDQQGACSWDIDLREPAHLSHWQRKFDAGREVNRAFLRLAENAPPRVLPLTPELRRQGFKFSVTSFDEQQSKAIMERAESEAGYLMVMPYTLALTVQILHGIFRNRGIDSGDYVIPVTMDTRPRSKVAHEVFFNHVSFLLFRIQAHEVDDFSALLKSIKEQMYDQARAGLTRDLWEASFLMRIVPLRILRRLMGLYLKGELASFCFSFVGETGHMLTRFMGREVDRSYHMTRVPIPPGLGLFFHQSQGRLNAYVSYLEGLLSEDEVEAIVAALKSRLGC